MPYCESCNKKDLKKTEIGVAPDNRVICLECYSKEFPGIQVEEKPSDVEWEVHVSSKKGFEAGLKIGETKFSVSASPEQLTKLLE